MKNITLKEFINKKNIKKIFTPSPSFPIENLYGLSSNFSRGDIDFEKQYEMVIKRIKKLSGSKKLVSAQGPASLAIEIGLLNFVRGKVLVVSTGFYSDRLFSILKMSKKRYSYVKKIEKIDYKNLSEITKNKYDWICACYTETSKGFKINIEKLNKIKKKTNSKLFIDATASIGIEDNHNLADVVSFSSCKSLFGLTGACFVGYNTKPKNKIDSFMLDINSHINKKMTGPNSTIQSLDFVTKNYSKFKKNVKKNKSFFMKKYKNLTIFPTENQPNICTYISSKVKNKKNLILYKPRIESDGSLIFHLGAGHLDEDVTSINSHIKILK
tara:strand:+ start:2535 stop:3515 length:981 start_codon:yes stop_codon:yes gene_type:complete